MIMSHEQSASVTLRDAGIVNEIVAWAAVVLVVTLRNMSLDVTHHFSARYQCTFTQYCICDTHSHNAVS
jgi:hypothetical protein